MTSGGRTRKAFLPTPFVLLPLVPRIMVDVTKQTYGNRIDKSPDFAKDIVVTFCDDVSVETARLLRENIEGKNEWVKPMMEEVILDWNLTDENGKLPITVESLDRIKSMKLRNWIIASFQEIVLSGLSEAKKK